MSKQTKEQRRKAHLWIARLLFRDLMDGVPEAWQETQWEAIDRHLKWAGRSREALVPVEDEDDLKM